MEGGLNILEFFNFKGMQGNRRVILLMVCFIVALIKESLCLFSKNNEYKTCHSFIIWNPTCEDINRFRNTINFPYIIKNIGPVYNGKNKASSVKSLAIIKGSEESCKCNHGTSNPVYIYDGDQLTSLQIMNEYPKTFKKRRIIILKNDEGLEKIQNIMEKGKKHLKENKKKHVEVRSHLKSLIRMMIYKIHKDFIQNPTRDIPVRLDYIRVIFNQKESKILFKLRDHIVKELSKDSSIETIKRVIEKEKKKIEDIDIYGILEWVKNIDSALLIGNTLISHDHRKEEVLERIKRSVDEVFIKNENGMARIDESADYLVPIYEIIELLFIIENANEVASFVSSDFKIWSDTVDIHFLERPGMLTISHKNEKRECEVTDHILHSIMEAKSFEEIIKHSRPAKDTYDSDDDSGDDSGNYSGNYSNDDKNCRTQMTIHSTQESRPVQ